MGDTKAHPDRESAARSIVYDDRAVRQWFRKHPKLEDAIERTINAQIENGLFRCKFATSLRWHGVPVYECRVNERSVGAVRVAFAFANGACTVLFISSDLQKRIFTAELERSLRSRPACR